MVGFDIRVATSQDVPAIVNLANVYTYQNLPEEERKAGFLTGTFSEVMVDNMICSAPSIVAYKQTDLAGFIVNTMLSPYEYPPLVQEIIKVLPDFKFRKLPVTQYPYFFYGPVLVATQYRRQGLLRQMFIQAKKELYPHYHIGIAFVDRANQASYQIHTQHLGFAGIGEIIFNNRLYAILGISLGEV